MIYGVIKSISTYYGLITVEISQGKVQQHHEIFETFNEKLSHDPACLHNEMLLITVIIINSMELPHTDHL